MISGSSASQVITSTNQRLLQSAAFMRDHNAVFKAAFAQHVEMVSSFTRAQSTAFSRALEFAKREGVDYLEIEGNHPFVFRMMWGDVTRTSSMIRGLLINADVI
ncbi:hypothetical protein GBA52_010998 [Prunus armeniaca]|nr:hypothetical protein GBA52_010998 [Prunus armeniaca]